MSEQLEAKIEQLASEWEVKAQYAKKYALMPKSAGINVTQTLAAAAHYEVSAEALRRAIAECAAA
jgi:hypothetical protein